jgi:hypothetical protein
VNRLGDTEWIVGANNPITFRDSEPEPSCAVFLGPDTPYTRRNPRPNETVFVAEVADVTLARDQGIKLALYASGRIPIYWVVNIPDRRIEVYTDPRGGKGPTYRRLETYRPGGAVPVSIGGTELDPIPVEELLPGG